MLPSQRLGRALSRRAPRVVPESELRPAAVLVPLVCGSEGTTELLLTRRADDLRHQPGHISFPGGSIDPSDASPLAAALRESEEEVGLLKGDVEVLGQMDPIASVTGYLVTPFVASVRGPYRFRPNHEVAELILVPLDWFREPGVLEIEHRLLPGGARLPIYHYRYQRHDIWGLTARLIKELLDLLDRE